MSRRDHIKGEAAGIKAARRFGALGPLSRLSGESLWLAACEQLTEAFTECEIFGHEAREAFGLGFRAAFVSLCFHIQEMERGAR